MALNYFVSLLYFLLLNQLLIPQIHFVVSKTSPFSKKDDLKLDKKFTLVSTSLSTPKKKFKRSYDLSEDCHILTIPIKSSQHEICIIKNNLTNQEVTFNDIKIIVFGSTQADVNTYALEDVNITLANGYDLKYPFSSAIQGYIEDNQFYGKIQIGSKTFYLEPLQEYPIMVGKMKSFEKANVNAVLFEEAELTLNPMLSDEMFVKNQINVENPSQQSKVYFKHQHNYVKSTEFRGKKNPKGKVCSILLLADHMFFRHVAARNVRTATNLMLDMLHEADAIFRNSDFNGDGLPDNIGFKARYIIILTSNKSSMNHLQGYGLDGGAPVDGKVYLHHLSSYELLQRVCAGVAFTAQPFQSKALGLSFTSVRNSLGRNGDQIGGICDRPRGSGLSFNALTITLMTDTGSRISRATSQLALAHELGHSFGARHDPLEGACQGYLMKPTSINGSQRTHYSFSPCSLRQIAHTIKLKGYCLDEFEHPYCGNGLVEEGEECDCGLVVDCLTRDPCCIARGGRSHACLANREAGHECHPSQGPCCLPNCRNRDLAHLGLNCSEENRGCPCTGDSTCSCGLLGRCLSGACHNIECTRLGLKECPCKYPENHCGTCCLSHEGTCIPAIHLTESVIRSGNVSLISLRQPPSTAPPYSIRTVKVCHSTNCLNVSFRIWEKGGFCVHLGKLGVCSKDGLCDVSRPVGSTFPDFSTSDRLTSVNVGVLKQIGNKCLSICFFIQLIAFLNYYYYYFDQ